MCLAALLTNGVANGRGIDLLKRTRKYHREQRFTGEF
jgi:hypothetical protein